LETARRRYNTWCYTNHSINIMQTTLCVISTVHILRAWKSAVVIPFPLPSSKFLTVNHITRETEYRGVAFSGNNSFHWRFQLRFSHLFPIMCCYFCVLKLILKSELI
jgi:hypothetical protein